MKTSLKTDFANTATSTAAYSPDPAPDAISIEKTGFEVPEGPLGLDLDFSPLAGSVDAASGAPNSRAKSLTPPTATVVLLDPERIRVGNMPNRTDEAFRTESFDELCHSITMVGCNVQPIVVLAVQPGPSNCGGQVISDTSIGG